MADYDFSTLNSSDLEELVCDLLNSDQPDNSKLRYRTFKEGKDKGIDFLYSTAHCDYEHVGQVKHYHKTGYSKLIASLKKDEVKKVSKLNPSKYIFATSLELSVHNTQKIKSLFNPYIKTLSDIYGKNDLNRLVEKYPDVHQNHYKLWFSNTEVFRSLLDSDMMFRSTAFIEDELIKRLKLFVETDTLLKAIKILEDKKFIIIAGEPGVGKTTLAEMLTFKFIGKGYKLNYVLEDIKEAEEALLPDESKQIIYFDDFLGGNAVEINKAKGGESKLLKILRRIKQTKNKYLVFTTRSHIYQKVLEDSERLRRLGLGMHKAIVSLQDYNIDIKEKILENHIELSNISEEHKKVCSQNGVRNFIVKHQNFTPRFIEFITDHHIISKVEAEDYSNFIKNTFNSPYEIWQGAYEQQTDNNEKLLLNTLLSFGDRATINHLQEAFSYRLDYEIKYNGWTKEPFVWRKTFSSLLDGFLIVKNDDEVHFINPSLIDFLLSYLREDRDEVNRIVHGARFIKQLTSRLFSLSGLVTEQMPVQVANRMLSDYRSYVAELEYDDELIEIVLTIHRFIKTPQSVEVIAEILESIEDWTVLNEEYNINNAFKEFIESVRDNPVLGPIIETNILEILNDIILGQYEIDSVIDILNEFVVRYRIDFSDSPQPRLISHIEELFNEEIDNEIDWLKDVIRVEGQEHDKIEEFKGLIEEIHKLGLEIKPDMKKFSNVDWWFFATENEFQIQMAKDD